MRLSIVVNMFNTAQYLPKCMDALLHQDIKGEEYEIILVDDGSTDESLALANNYVSQRENNPSWPFIRVCTHANKGLAGARNTGVDAAIGQYLCFVDPDDYIEENSLSALLQQMDDEQLDVLRFNYQKVDENGNRLVDSDMEAAFDYTSKIMSGIEFMVERLTTTCYVWAYIYRLDLIKQNNIRFIEGIYFDDTPWLPRILQLAKRINCSSMRHQYYLQRSGSLVRTMSLTSILKKVQGQLELVDIMNEQMKQSELLVQRWYKLMIAHTCTSLLTSVAVYDYANREYYLKQLNGQFPLMIDRHDSKMKKKIYLLNICPRLLMLLIYLKSKI